MMLKPTCPSVCYTRPHSSRYWNAFHTIQ